MSEVDFSEEPEYGRESFPVKLEGFEGPLDLLLYLIRTQEIDIYDIPIARITEQYLNYINMMKMLNLEIAGEYLLMAATLIRIKARLLMPKHEGISDDEGDPREELIMALLEYKKYKEASEKLRRWELEERQIRVREDFSYLKPEIVEAFAVEATLYDLAQAFAEIIKYAADTPTHQVDNFGITIEDQVEYVLNYLEQDNQATLDQIVEVNHSKLYYIVTFLALLELAKLRRIILQQNSMFGVVYVRKT